jgi:hypothetical protein
MSVEHVNQVQVSLSTLAPGSFDALQPALAEISGQRRDGDAREASEPDRIVHGQDHRPQAVDHRTEHDVAGVLLGASAPNGKHTLLDRHRS